MVPHFNRRKLLVFLFVVLVGGCMKAPSNLEQTIPKIIFFSTKDFKFYDTGFIKTYANGDISLEIFNVGHLLLRFLVFQDRICINQQCYAKASAVRQFFGNDAMRGIDFSEILQGKEIFGGKNKENLKNGYEQKLQIGSSKIVYQVTDKQIYFKENTSGFTLIVTELN